jgi:antirestriction protein ArdC
MNAYETITSKVIAQLEAGCVPWQKPWEGGLAGQPKNLLSQKEYRGVNTWMLTLGRFTDGFSSPYWLTYKQAKEVGGYVKEGMHGYPVIKALFVSPDDVGKKAELDQVGAFRGIKLYTVFNADQCSLPESLTPLLRPTPAHDWQPLSQCESLVAGMPKPPVIDNAGGDRAFYRPSTDSVSLPLRSSFSSPESYYNVLFHELGHSTGHSSRLARPGILESHSFGDAVYSKEELIAEMTATFLAGITGIENVTFSNSAAYLSGWLKVLKKDSSFLVQSAAAAQKAADYIRGLIA